MKKVRLDSPSLPAQEQEQSLVHDLFSLLLLLMRPLDSQTVEVDYLAYSETVLSMDPRFGAVLWLFWFRFCVPS